MEKEKKLKRVIRVRKGRKIERTTKKKNRTNKIKE